MTWSVLSKRVHETKRLSLSVPSSLLMRSWAFCISDALTFFLASALMMLSAAAESFLTSMESIHWFDSASSFANAVALADGAAIAVAGRISRQSIIASK